MHAARKWGPGIGRAWIVGAIALALAIVVGWGAGARADVAPDPPETWSARVVEARAEGRRLRVVFEVRNQGEGALALRVDPDTSARDGDRRHALRATGVRAGDAPLAIEEEQRGPHTVRTTGPFTVPASGVVRVTVEYESEQPLPATLDAGIKVHEVDAWRGMRLRFDQRAWTSDRRGGGSVLASAPDAVHAATGAGCSCRAAASLQRHGSSDPSSTLALAGALALLLTARRRPARSR